MSYNNNRPERPMVPTRPPMGGQSNQNSRNRSNVRMIINV
jgi:hypothetical protein